MHPSVNVLGTELQTCSNEPKTGWYRDGCCNTDENAVDELIEWAKKGYRWMNEGVELLNTLQQG